jgi:BR-signaling kinase
MYATGNNVYVCISCTQALDIMRGRNIQAVMDSHLEGNYSIEVATPLVNLASQCLQYEPRDRPDIKKLVSILEPLQIKLEVTIFISSLFHI